MTTTSLPSRRRKTKNLPCQSQENLHRRPKLRIRQNQRHRQLRRQLFYRKSRLPLHRRQLFYQKSRLPLLRTPLLPPSPNQLRRPPRLLLRPPSPRKHLQNYHQGDLKKSRRPSHRDLAQAQVTKQKRTRSRISTGTTSRQPRTLEDRRSLFRMPTALVRLLL